MQQRFTAMLPTIRKVARARFRAYRDAEDKIAEAEALAWKGYLACLRNGNRRFTAGTLANYACRQVRDGRRVARFKSRSVHGRPAREKGARRVTLRDFIDPRQDPGTIVRFKLDVPAWLATLPKALKRTVDAILSAGPGDRDMDVAARLGVSPGRLSQRRRELLRSWDEFDNAA
jgi:hypothetical protein